MAEEDASAEGLLAQPPTEEENMWWIEVLIALGGVIGGWFLNWGWNKWQKDRALSKDEAERQRQNATDFANAPVIEGISLECSDEEGTSFTVKNFGETPARNVRARFDGPAAGEFHMYPEVVPVLGKGETAVFKCEAKSIHFLNPYVFGRFGVRMHVTWNAPHFQEEQVWNEGMQAGLPKDPTFPIVEMDDWKAFHEGLDWRYRKQHDR